MRRLLSKSKIIKGGFDPVKHEDSFYPKGEAILMQAQRCWDSLRSFRQERDRCQRYCYGDQLGDSIVVDGKQMTESDYLKEQEGMARLGGK